MLVRNTSADSTQPVHDVDALVGREVEHDAALAAVVELEQRVDVEVAAEHALERSGRIALGRLDLDDVGAPVGEDAARTRAGDPHAELDDPDPLERQVGPSRLEGLTVTRTSTR